MSSFLRGRVDRLIHSSGTYHVLLLEVLEHSGFEVPRAAVAAGHLFGLGSVETGVCLQLDGAWVTHKQHGRQFKIATWHPWASKPEDMLPFLSRCARVSMNDELLEELISAFGRDLYAALGTEQLLSYSTEPADLVQLADINARWRTVLAMASLFPRLQQEYELGASAVASVIARFGENAVNILASNPYRLIEVEGLSFARVDAIAREKGLGVDDHRRLGAALLWLLGEESKQGHLFLHRAQIAPRLEALVRSQRVIGFDLEGESALEAALVQLENDGAVRVDPDVGVYLPDLYQYERESAKLLSELLPSSPLELPLAPFLEAYERDNDIALSEQQRAAVDQILKNRVLVVTGAPGTGKTTLIRTFVQLFTALNISHILVAPTGIAAKRLGYVTGTSASTVHRALKYDGFRWGRHRESKVVTQAVILDEASMCPQELFYRLLDALEPQTILVLVGDDAQLPSVGPGNVLRELIACEAVPTVRLNVVFRQAETSDIVRAAHYIRDGRSPLDMSAKEDSELRFVPMQDEHEIANLICQMAQKLKQRDANFQVLSPKYDGPVGVTRLNELLRDALNPYRGQPTFELDGLHARVGDRLMVIKNDYKLNVYNGDIGKLVEVTKKGLRIKIHPVGSEAEALVEIPRDSAPQMLRLAYAVTVHRCQGEEFETVIMPIVRSHGRMLQRNLFYTALTRARKRVWLLGDAHAVQTAVDNDKVIERNTVLRELVKAPV